MSFRKMNFLSLLAITTPFSCVTIIIIWSHEKSNKKTGLLSRFSAVFDGILCDYKTRFRIQGIQDLPFFLFRCMGIFG